MPGKILLFAFGLLLLIKGSDYFVKAAASLAKKLGVSEFVIGLTLVALGTSVPELASAIFAAVNKQSGLVVGTVIGANMANILLVTGIAAVFAIVKTRQEMVERDGYIMFLATGLFCFFVSDGTLSRIEAALMLVLYIAYTLFLFTAKPDVQEEFAFKKFINYLFRFRYILTIKDGLLAGFKHGKEKGMGPVGKKKLQRAFKESIIKDLLVMLAGGTAIAFGADYFIGSASFFAMLMNIPPLVIGASIVSLGTTLPEMSVTVSAARKGYGNIAIGNVLGSCITNVCLIIGTAGLIFPLSVNQARLPMLLTSLILASVLLLVFLRSAWRIRKWEGAILLALYILFMALLFSGLS